MTIMGSARRGTRTFARAKSDAELDPHVSRTGHKSICDFDSADPCTFVLFSGTVCLINALEGKMRKKIYSKVRNDDEKSPDDCCATE
jgi:hypothetical protein